jgi:uncharacterized surface protein with fasciclin (FAS1) repeats
MSYTLFKPGGFCMRAQSIFTAITCAVLGVATVMPTFATDETTGGKMSTASTQDIVNTLRSRGAFHKMLDGLEQSFDLDNELKGKGPYTVFAADDKGWAKINQTDQDTLFGNKNKLAQVLRDEVVKGKCLDSNDLKSMSSVLSLDGKMLKIASKPGDKKENDVWVNNAKIKTADIRCTNGIIHIMDQPIMPALVQ